MINLYFIFMSVVMDTSEQHHLHDVPECNFFDIPQKISFTIVDIVYNCIIHKITLQAASTSQPL